ncbi:MAG: nucleotide exchange factor GrpE [Desulfitobacteriaceae bacterium]|nr:nucleotide exchange factor GrpE [Desulfitobacteriaceae bacterium]
MKDVAESGQLDSTLLGETLNNETIDEEPTGKDGESSVGELIPANEFSMKYETTETSLETDVSSGGMEASAILIGDVETTDIMKGSEITERKLDINSEEQVLIPDERTIEPQVLNIVGEQALLSQDQIGTEQKGVLRNNNTSAAQFEQLQRQINELENHMSSIMENIVDMRDKIKTNSTQVKALESIVAPGVNPNVLPAKEFEINQETANECVNKIDPVYEEPIYLDKQKEEEPLIFIPETIVQEAHQQAVNGYIKDQQEMDGYQESALGWDKKGKIIQGTLPDMVIHCNDVLQQAELARESCSCQSDKLRDLIMGRQEGIILIVNRMISRLPERAISLSEYKSLESKLPQMDLSEWQKLLNGSDNVEEANKKVASRQKQLGTERYRILANWREESDKKRKTILSFVERQVLPVLDGIGDGERHSEPIMRQVQEVAELQGKEMNSSLQLWFDTYRALREEILKLLAMVGIRRLDVKRGDKMDYDRHEPFDVEQDMALENEYVKEVIRDGFEYWMEEDNLYRVLRPAQVIIVKN